MKKFIYPVAAIFTLITMSAFTPEDCAIKCKGKGTTVETSALTFQESDNQIDIQFNREETTIELTYELQSDDLVNSQFMAENEIMLAAK